MLKNDRWITGMANKGMIEPFSEGQVSPGRISSGASAYGYDMRISDEFKILKAATQGVIDPKAFNPEFLTDFKGDVCTLPPNSFLLGRSLEYFRIPRNILVVCFGKSTYARCGVLVNITPLEPEWEGYVTIAVSNTSHMPARIYANEGIAQIIFLEAAEVCEKSYADKKGKYQAQKTITTAR